MGSSGATWRCTWVIGLAAVALLGACGEGSLAGSGLDGGGAAIADGGSALDGGGTAADGGSAPDGGAVAPDGGGSEPDGGGVVADGGVAADGGGTDGGPTSDGGSATPVVRFAAMGDTGKGNSGQSQVAAAVQAKCAARGCDFVVLLGDNIYDNGVSSADDPQFQTKFEQPYANINLPFYVVLGNHDYGGSGAGYEFNKGPYEVEYSSRSTKWRMPATYYRIREQHVEFFGLDTNSQMYDRADDQKADLPQWLAASTATWKIAMGHHPYLSNGPHGNAGSYDGVPFIPIANGAGVKDFFEAVICGKVDLYLCGHDHSRQWLTATCNGTELAVSGAGASTTDLPGSNATRFQASTLGFLYVRIEGRTLTAEFVNAAGEAEFTRALVK